MGMELPRAIKPGQEGRGVPYAKRRAVKKAQGDAKAMKLAKAVNVESKVYGASARALVKYLQSKYGLKADGVIGPRTWRMLGVTESNLCPEHLRGIPWEWGLRPFDGNWVNEHHHAQLTRARRKGWTGRLTSSYRPDWYQKILWDAAVKKYGSEAEAAKWVARPGTSNHRFKTNKMALDVTNGAQLSKIEPRWYQPYSWEAWHRQWRPAYS